MSTGSLWIDDDEAFPQKCITAHQNLSGHHNYSNEIGFLWENDLEKW